jgi:hypothetical protein
MSKKDFVSFADHMFRAGLGQAWFPHHHVGGQMDSPDLSQGLRFKGEPSDYHDLKIHRDDVETFIKRVKAYRFRGVD